MNDDRTFTERVADVLEASHEMAAAVKKAGGSDMDPFALSNMLIGTALSLIDDAYGPEEMRRYAATVLESVRVVDTTGAQTH
jgi:hypothetical protein